MNASSANWDDLRLFLAVAREGSLSGAGRVLGITHSAFFPNAGVRGALARRQDIGRAEGAVACSGGHVAELKLSRNDVVGRSASLTQLGADGASLHVKAGVVRGSANADQKGADGALPDLKAGAAAFRARGRMSVRVPRRAKTCWGRARQRRAG